MKTLLLSKSDIQKLITYKEVVELCYKTYYGVGEGTVINPTKVNLPMGDSNAFPPHNSSMNAMPAYVGWLDMAGLKWQGGFASEQRRAAGLPFIHGLTTLCDPVMGNFLAVMDSGLISNMRTGGQTASIMQMLFKDRKNVKVGLYGCGVQGLHQVMAISAAFDIEELKVYDIYKPAAEKFESNMASFVKGNLVVCDDPKDVAADVDVVIAVTLAKGGFIKSEWIKPGTVYFAMGTYDEADDDTILKADKILVDNMGQCLHRGALAKVVEAGKLKEEDIYGTIGELAIGTKPVENFENERIVIVPIGLGAMDVAVAGTVYNKAISLSIGSEFSFDI
jgi:alanine dehydrogenase